ncbi:MAG: 30S ribosomal protein S17 [Dehalococcoidia bacterium]
MAGQQQTLVGTVMSDKMAKTVVVLVEHTTRHRLYRKILKRSKRYLAHDDRLDAKPGDRVRILQSRPLSARKRWRVIEIVRRGEVAEIAPREIDQQYLSSVREREAPPPPKPAAEVVAPEAAAPEAAAELEPPADAEPAAAVVAEEVPEEDDDTADADASAAAPAAALEAEDAPEEGDDETTDAEPAADEEQK